MANLPQYQSTVGPQPGRIQPVNTDGLVKSLRDWQNQKGQEEVDAAAILAGKEGAAVGKDTPLGQALPEAREDTAAGRAYLKAAGEAYLARAENDITSRLSALADEHPDDPVTFSKRANEYRDTLLSKMDVRTQGLVRAKADSSITSLSAQIASRAVVKAREADGAAVREAIKNDKNRLAAFAIKGDAESVLALDQDLSRRIDAAVKGGLIHPKEVPALQRDLKRTIIENTFEGDYHDAVAAGKGGEFIRKIEKQAVLHPELSPEENTAVKTKLKGLWDAQYKRDLDTQALTIRDSLATMYGGASKLSAEQQRAFISEATADLGDPEVRTAVRVKAEALVKQLEADERAEEDRARVERSRTYRDAYARADATTRLFLKDEFDAKMTSEDKVWTDGFDKTIAKNLFPEMTAESYRQFYNLRNLASADPAKFLAVTEDTTKFMPVFDKASMDAIIAERDQARRLLEARARQAKSDAQTDADRKKKAEDDALDRADKWRKTASEEIDKLGDRLRIPQKKDADGSDNPEWANFQKMKWEMIDRWDPTDRGDPSKAVARMASQWQIEVKKQDADGIPPEGLAREWIRQHLEKAGLPLTPANMKAFWAENRSKFRGGK